MLYCIYKNNTFLQESYIKYVGVDEPCIFNTLLKDNVLRIIRNTHIKQLRIQVVNVYWKVKYSGCRL